MYLLLSCRLRSAGIPRTQWNQSRCLQCVSSRRPNSDLFVTFHSFGEYSTDPICGPFSPAIKQTVNLAHDFARGGPTAQHGLSVGESHCYTHIFTIL